VFLCNFYSFYLSKLYLCSEIHKAVNITKSEISVIDDKLIAAQVYIFFLAGFETSSTTMSFAMYELAANPEIQKKLYNEIQTVYEKHCCISYDAICEMEYLDRVIRGKFCIKIKILIIETKAVNVMKKVSIVFKNIKFLETLRKYPPVAMTQRVCEESYQIPGTDVVIEKGTKVLVPIYAIHHDPLYYKNPDVFDPDRFLDENKKLRDNYAFLPFGDGPRICIGNSQINLFF
jgi:cytochrome P450 family 6